MCSRFKICLGTCILVERDKLSGTQDADAVDRGPYKEHSSCEGTAFEERRKSD